MYYGRMKINMTRFETIPVTGIYNGPGNIHAACERISLILNIMEVAAAT